MDTIKDCDKTAAKIEELYGRIDLALEHALSGGFTDGAHHKQWALDQVMRALFNPGEYEKWRKSLTDEPGYYTEWDEGIP